MAAERFVWRPEVGAEGEVSFAELRAQFGDNYAQRAPDGLNTERQSWPLTFRGPEEEIVDIVAFLRRNAHTSFLWTPPMGVEGHYQHSGYRLVPHGAGNYTVRTTFQLGIIL